VFTLLEDQGPDRVPARHIDMDEHGPGLLKLGRVARPVESDWEDVDPGHVKDPHAPRNLAGAVP